MILSFVDRILLHKHLMGNLISYVKLLVVLSIILVMTLFLTNSIWLKGFLIILLLMVLKFQSLIKINKDLLQDLENNLNTDDEDILACIVNTSNYLLGIS